jgi:hypothetical protein
MDFVQAVQPLMLYLLYRELFQIFFRINLKLYSAFVDFPNRRILIYKLLRNGLSTKSVAMVKSIYSSVRHRVKAGGKLSDAFNNLLSVKQGEPLFLCNFYFLLMISLTIYPRTQLMVL